MSVYLTSTEFADQSLVVDVINGLTTAQIDEALAWASRQADSYLSKRYALPLISWSDDLKSVVGDLAQYRLLARQGFRPQSGNDQIAVKRYDDAIGWLRDIARGLVELVDCVDQTPAVDEEGPLVSVGSVQPFQFFTGRRSSGCGGCER